MVNPGAGVEVRNLSYPGQTLERFFPQTGSLIDNLPVFNRIPEVFNFNQGPVWPESNQGDFSSASSLSSDRSGVCLPGCSHPGFFRTHVSSSRPRAVSSEFNKVKLSIKGSFNNSKLLNVPSPVRKIPSVSSPSLSSSKDSVKDVFKRLFFPNLTSTL